MTAHDTRDTTGRTAVGLFTNVAHAEAAAQDLESAGFTRDQIGVAMRDEDRQRHFDENPAWRAVNTAAGGAAAGGIAGSVFGLLVGVGAVVIPGLGPIVAAGILAPILAGTGVGATAGGILGGLVGLGVPEEHAHHFRRGLEAGGALVAVNAGRRTDEALRILDRHGADFGPDT